MSRDACEEVKQRQDPETLGSLEIISLQSRKLKDLEFT